MSNDNSSIWEIVPHIGVGPLTFGQARSNIRLVLGTPSRTFKKTPFADNDTDAYDDLGVHLYFDPDDRLESVDAWGLSSVRFNGLDLLEMPADVAVHALEQMGLEHSSYLFTSAGFSLYIIDGLIKGVTIFAPGYYDTTNPNSAASRAIRAVEKWRKSQ